LDTEKYLLSGGASQKDLDLIRKRLLE